MKAEPTTKELIEMLYERHPEIFHRPKQEWVGLTPTNMEELSAEWWEPNENEMVLIAWVEATLRSKNA